MVSSEKGWRSCTFSSPIPDKTGDRRKHPVASLKTISLLCLQGNAYVERGVFGRGANANSVLLAGFRVEVDTVFDAD